MKTKRFLLATAGSTVDGREIDAAMLEQMASSYDPKTYGARLNIEHLRGLSGQAPFRAYGDVLSLDTEEVEVNFNGKTEKRLGLFGVFDVNDDAKALNEQGQKVYPSIEINPDFGNKGHAYLMGVALTDSPASIATERLQFNRSLPGAITLARDSDGQSGEAALLEFAADASAVESEGFVASFGAMLEKTLGKFAAKPEPVKPEPKPGEQAGSFSAADLQPVLADMGQMFATELGKVSAQISEFRSDFDQLSVKVKKIESETEGAPAENYNRRPLANGSAAAGARTDC